MVGPIVPDEHGAGGSTEPHYHLEISRNDCASGNAIPSEPSRQEGKCSIIPLCTQPLLQVCMWHGRGQDYDFGFSLPLPSPQFEGVHGRQLCPAHALLSAVSEKVSLHS
ncbi:hypothetical protein KIL84_010919 [Mauremys mutica]|uniref:Uncharacterized protein n=1 Tax=Mauremys mutica TaxID=74926 RepID=A0A9D3XC16_9SAUR|nr:hypothetical protein KIL84_010919 [Mauremys mutica]